MNNKMEDIVVFVLAVVWIAVAAIWIFSSDLEYIEDTNGPDNYTLTTITDETESS